MEMGNQENHEFNPYVWSNIKAHLSSPLSGNLNLETTFLNLDPGTPTTILSSYPRSGNTLLRSYCEKMTGIYTGSDCSAKRKLNRELLEMGMKGEGIMDKSVLFVKTHFPERMGCQQFWGEKCVLIVRNPLDCITSLFNMVATSTHSESIS